MSHWAYFAAAALNVWMYAYSVDESRHMLLLGAIFLVIHGTGERVINHLKKERASAHE